MRDEVLQLMVWCIGTKKFSAEQIAEASDMISTHAMGSSSTASHRQPPSTVPISTASKTPTSLGLSCSTDIALCFIQSNTCLCPPSHLISTNQWNTSWCAEGENQAVGAA
jgi:hypothetical protein